MGQSTIIFEYRRSPLSKTKHADTKPRNNQTSPAAEWFSMGLNCGGAALAWIGVVGAGAAEPITGGMDTPATIILWGGAIAASGQCAASFTRVTALETGHKKFEEEIDNSTTYVWTMRGLDVVGLLGVKGAIVDIVKTREALKLSGVEWERAVAAQISRQQRRTITEKLALEGSKRVAAQSISLVVKQRILAAVAAGVGMATSTSVGATHDLVVWIMSPQPKK